MRCGSRRSAFCNAEGQIDLTLSLPRLAGSWVHEVDGDCLDGSAKVTRTHFFYDFPIHPASLYAEAPRWQPL
jgi:hypothetical protein